MEKERTYLPIAYVHLAILTTVSLIFFRYLVSKPFLSTEEKKAIELGKADTIVSFLPRGNLF